MKLTNKQKIFFLIASLMLFGVGYYFADEARIFGSRYFLTGLKHDKFLLVSLIAIVAGIWSAFSILRKLDIKQAANSFWNRHKMKFFVVALIAAAGFGGAGGYEDNHPRVWNVKLFGASGDSVTNDASAIQATINACDAAGGGVVYFPKPSVYYQIGNAINATHNSQLYIPVHTDGSRNHIILLGEAAPNFVPVGGGLPSSATTKAIGGTRLKSTLTTFTSAGQAVIGSSGTYTNLTVENLAIEVKNNPSGNGPVVGGIQWAGGLNLFANNVVVYIDTAGNKSTLPQNAVYGIETPNDAQGDNYVISNMLVIGMKAGGRFGEHVKAYNFQAWCNYYGINFKTGGHASEIRGANLQWNYIDRYWSGIVPLFPSTFDEEIEYTAHSGGKWYDNAFTDKDTANLGTGEIHYKITLAGGGDATVTKSGATKLRYYRYDTTDFAVLNRATNTFDAGASTKINLNGTSGVGYSWSKNGIQLWLQGTESLGTADKSLQWFNNKLNRPVGLLDSLGNVNLAGSSPNVAATSALQAQVGGNVYIPTSMSIGTSSASSPYSLDILTTAGNGGMRITNSTASQNAVYVATNSSGTAGYYRTFGSSYSISSLQNKTALGSDQSVVIYGGASNGASGASTSISFRPDGYDIAAERAVMDRNSFTFKESVIYPYVAKSTSYTITAAEGTVNVTATGQTITLPTAVGITGRVYTIKLTASGSSTVATTSSQTIDGSTTYSLSAQYKYVIVQSDGANWIVIANN